MTKDYAKKKRPNYSQRSRSRFHEQRAIKRRLFGPWIGILLGLVFGALLAVLIYWKGNPSFPKFHHSKASQKKQKEAQNEIKERRFDFYTVLPNMDFDDSNVEAVAVAKKQQPSPETPASKTSEPTNTDSYIVQLGSFKSLQQAEQLKAELAFNGLQARIQTFKMGPKDTWHRVYVGPFNSKEIAETKIKQLNQTQVRNSLVIKNSV